MAYVITACEALQDACISCLNENDPINFSFEEPAVAPEGCKPL